MQHLQPNTTLQGGKYRIERVLGQGGFGNTYVGYNTEFEETVAIKEFFMKGVTERDETTSIISVSNADNVQQFEEQREKFKKEALRIRKLDNPYIVKVHDLFEENGTAYYVMDFVEGENLSQRLKRTGKPMAERKVREIFLQLLDALKAMHDAGMWHLDIKPANIMLDKEGNVKLIDFGASKQLNAQKGGATTSTAISYTNGYAPREQMEQNYDKFGPWTDIYALGATLYNLLTNKRPPMPSDIDDDISEDKHNALPFPATTSTDMKQLVVQMMQTNRLQRPQSIDAVMDIVKLPKTKRKTIPNSGSEDTIIAKPRAPHKENKDKPKSDANISVQTESKSDGKTVKLWGWLTAIVIIVLGSLAYSSLNKPNFYDEYAKAYSVYMTSDSNKVAKEDAISVFRELGNEGYGPAVYMQGITSSDSLEAEKFFQRAMDFLPKEAESGDMFAQFCLGDALYKQGKRDEAFQWFKKSAEQGQPEAMQSLAWCYLFGIGGNENVEAGMNWQYKAAESNIPSILYMTGALCEEFAEDSIKAFDYYKKAADLGDVEASLRVGGKYRDGHNVKQDYGKALYYYTRAAEKGSAIGYINVGTIYFLSYRDYAYFNENSDVEANLNKAINNLKESLKIDENVDAHYWLGLCYWYAKDENKDDTKAFNHIKIAAEGNHPAAQMQLYFFYCHGIGVEPNQELAQMWRKRAIENGYEEE